MLFSGWGKYKYFQRLQPLIKTGKYLTILIKTLPFWYTRQMGRAEVLVFNVL